MVPGRHGLDHRRLAVRVEPGKEHARLHLRARDRELVLDRAQRAALDPERQMPAGRLHARAHPLQRFGDPCAQVLQGCRTQALHRCRGLMGRRPGQPQDSGDEDGIRLVGLRPGQDMVHRPVRQGRVDLPQGAQEVNEEPRFHGE